MRAPVSNVDFGKTAKDYLTHRAGFPESLFQKLAPKGIGNPNQTLLDLGTGTGTLGRGFAKRGTAVTGIDPAEDLLKAAQQLDREAGIGSHYLVGSAEQTGLSDRSFNVVAAGQCWHWFNAKQACREIKRLLKPTGQLVIAYYDWLPVGQNMVRQTEQLIEQHNPDWRGGNGTGIHPDVFVDLDLAGFKDIESFTYDEPAIYSHEAWRGRIRASAGVAATLSHEATTRFDHELAELLADNFPDEPMAVPHRVFALTAHL